MSTLSAYDVAPTIKALLGIVRDAMTPCVAGTASVAVVYDDIPLLFSDQAPALFAEYRGGSNTPDAYVDPVSGVQSSTREWDMDIIALQCLASETNTADQMVKAFVGPFIDLVRHHMTIGDLVDQAYVTEDRVEPFRVNGPQGPVYLANVFTVHVTEFVE